MVVRDTEHSGEWEGERRDDEAKLEHVGKMKPSNRPQVRPYASGSPDPSLPYPYPGAGAGPGQGAMASTSSNPNGTRQPQPQRPPRLRPSNGPYQQQSSPVLSQPSPSPIMPLTSSGPSPRSGAIPRMMGMGIGGGGGSSAGASREGGPRPQDKRKSRVGAILLKKRQSVSYNVAVSQGIPGLPGGGKGGRGGGGQQEVIPSIPAMPSMPSLQINSGLSAVEEYVVTRERSPSPSAGSRRNEQDPRRTGDTAVGSGGRQTPVGARGAPPPLDMAALAASGDYSPDEYLKRYLAMYGAGPPGSKTYLDAMRQVKQLLVQAQHKTSEDLQRNVFHNYAEFVKISKEIAILETEMLELKGVLEEWKGVPESLEVGSSSIDSGFSSLSSGSLGDRRRMARNSIADLAALYRAQLEALWEGVEGSQKFLPPVTGRHLIAESPSFVELNSATYKPERAVHLFLLNDALLVAIKKRRQMGSGRVKLVAERCFGLSEIVVVDLKDGGGLTNAIKIKKGKEMSIFRTERPEDKRALLIAFKKVAEELMDKKRKDNLYEAERRNSSSGGLSRLASSNGVNSNLSATGFSPSKIFGFGNDDPTGKDLTWISDLADELALKIALRDFEEGVALIEKGKSVLPKISQDPLATSLLRTKLDERTSDLVSSLLQDISDPLVRKTSVIRLSSYLVRLSQGDRAREVFLEGRGQLVKKRAKQIKFEGDIVVYISELAMVVFTLIRNSCDWYMAAFKENKLASGFVRWAKEQVEVYAAMFRRQVYGEDQDRRVIEEALEVTKMHGAMLHDVGLDFAFLLEDLLRSAPQGKLVDGKTSLRPTDGSNAASLARRSMVITREEGSRALATAGGP